MKRNFQTAFRLVGALALTVSGALTTQADPLYPTTVESQNPPGYYRLNETIQPANVSATNYGSLGASADGNYVSLPALNQPGPFAGSVSVGLDGVSQQVDTPYQAALNPSQFTIEIWVNPASASVSGGLLCVASSVHAGSPRAGWLIYQSDGTSGGTFPGYYLRLYNQNATSFSLALLAPQNPTPGTWTHLVYTFDGTTASAYLNGVLVNSGTPSSHNGVQFAPNPDSDFTVGSRSDGGFPWPGNAAETAIYGTALTAQQVANHYTAATTAPATYAATVLGDAPLAFYKYLAAPKPVANNSGTLGAGGNGLYLADAVAGAVGPRPPVYQGLEANNLAPSFDAGGGSVSLPAFNFNTNTITISGWVNADIANEAKGAGIVMCDGGTTAAGLTIDDYAGGLGLGYNWNNDPNTTQVSLSGDLGLPSLNQNEWAFVALVIQPTEADIYISSPTIPFTSVTNYYANPVLAFDAATLIGSDAGVPKTSFSGGIDEVGIWNRSLSSGELYTQYASTTNLPPIVFNDPVSPDQPIAAGDTLTLPVNAGGTPNLSYQWFLNNVLIPGATNGVYTKTNFSLATDVGNYFVIVTNLYGSATSGVAVVSGVPATAPVITSSPVGATIYPGGSLNLAVGATGGGLAYQWSLNGTPIAGATKSSYSLSNITTNNGGAYTVSVTNHLGATNAGPAVIAVPYLAPGTYAQVVDADAPTAWWRLDDAVATNGATLLDVMGLHSGTYTNNGGLQVGVPGAINGGLAGTAVSFSGDGSYGYIPYFRELSSQKFTLEVWVKQASVDPGATAVSAGDSAGNYYGVGAETYWQGLSTGGTFGQGPGVTAGYDPTIYYGQWTHVVITHDPEVISGTSYAYAIWVNGVTDGYIWGDSALDNGGPFIIGGQSSGTASILSQAFSGTVDEVAFYGGKVLSGSQIKAHYSAAYFQNPPQFAPAPQSQQGLAGGSATFSASLTGQLPIALQWEKNGVALPGQTNSTLTLNNLYYTDSADTYTLTATNAFGGVASSGVHVTVYYPPTYANLTNDLVLHLTFDGNLNDSSGQGNNGSAVGSPEFVPGFIGSQAISVLTDTTNSTYNYVTLGNPPDFQFSSNVNFSISYWVKFPTNAAPGDLPFFCSADNSTGGFGVTLSPGSGGSWQWSLDNVNQVGARIQGSSGALNDGGWHNVVETFDRSGFGSTYLDGALVNQLSIVGIGDIDSGGPFNIGQDPTGSYAQSGTYALDDIGLWRRALNYGEAVSIYVAGERNGKSFDSFGPATVSIKSLPNGQIGVSWQAGTLKQATNIHGPWTPVPGATAPYYQTTPTSTSVFYGVGQ